MCVKAKSCDLSLPRGMQNGPRVVNRRGGGKNTSGWTGAHMPGPPTAPNDHATLNALP